MTIRRITGPFVLTGLSTDTKPHLNTSPQEKFGPPEEGTTFYETDTGRRFRWERDRWEMEGAFTHTENVEQVLEELKYIRLGLESIIGYPLELLVSTEN